MHFGFLDTFLSPFIVFFNFHKLTQKDFVVLVNLTLFLTLLEAQCFHLLFKIAIEAVRADLSAFLAMDPRSGEVILLL